MSQYLTVSGYSVTPVVGLVQAQAEYVLDEFEVADVFEVPMSFFYSILPTIGLDCGKVSRADDVFIQCLMRTALFGVPLRECCVTFIIY
jgi:hypothetical protein